MIGLVLVTHGRLAAEFITAMEHVVGPQQAVEGICIDADDDMEMRRTEIACSPSTAIQASSVGFSGLPFSSDLRSSMRMSTDSFDFTRLTFVAAMRRISCGASKTTPFTACTTWGDPFFARA